jgi:hypothetical protein
MIPTNRLRWITRTVQVPTYGYASIPYGDPFAGICAPPVTMQVSVLQQWWSGINNNGDAIGEWRDIPVEVE